MKIVLNLSSFNFGFFQKVLPLSSQFKKPNVINFNLRIIYRRLSIQSSWSHKTSFLDCHFIPSNPISQLLEIQSRSFSYSSVPLPRSSNQFHFNIPPQSLAQGQNGTLPTIIPTTRVSVRRSLRRMIPRIISRILLPITRWFSIISRILRTTSSITPTQLATVHKWEMKSVAILRVLVVDGSKSHDGAALVSYQMVVFAQSPIAV